MVFGKLRAIIPLHSDLGSFLVRIRCPTTGIRYTVDRLSPNYAKIRTQTSLVFRHIFGISNTQIAKKTNAKLGRFTI